MFLDVGLETYQVARAVSRMMRCTPLIEVIGAHSFRNYDRVLSDSRLASLKAFFSVTSVFNCEYTTSLYCDPITKNFED